VSPTILEVGWLRRQLIRSRAGAIAEPPTGEISCDQLAMQSPSVQPVEFPHFKQVHVTPSLSFIEPPQCVEVCGGLADDGTSALETAELLTFLTSGDTDGTLFFKEKDQSGTRQRLVSFSQRLARRARLPLHQTLQGTHRNVFELLLPILMPPARTEFGKEFLLPGELYDFQRYGVKWLVEHDSALLADDMGLGKTVQAIVAFRVLLRQAMALQALVVCPKSVLTHWQREIDRWAPELIAAPVRGTQQARAAMWSAYVGKCHVLLTTYETVREDRDHIRGRVFDLVLLDEIQRIKNPGAQASQAARQLSRKRAWGLTGTPLENRVEEVVSVFGFLQPGLFRASDAPERRRGLRSWSDEMEQERWIKEVKRRIEPHMLRRRKQDALKDLPPKVKDVKYIELLETQRRTYDDAEQRGRIELETGEKVTIQHVLALITKLKQICNLDPRTKESAKLEFLQDYLEDAAAEQSKVLVFSQFVETLRFVEANISSYNPLVFSGELGDTARRRLIDEFRQSTDHKVLLLSLRAGGLGLNLPEANYVVHFDSWWNPAVESQAEDRAHRIGQTKTVFVTTLVGADTIEERIQGLLEQKRDLFTKVIDDLSDVGLTRVLSEEELFGLFGLKPRRPPKEPPEPDVITREAERRATPTTFEPATPYSNVLRLRNILRQCSGYVWWLDKHFSRKGLEPLAETVESPTIRQIRILSSEVNVTSEARKDFARFAREMASKGITAEWRVAPLTDVHDRYIVSEHTCFNIPPINTIYQGGYSEAFTTTVRPPFEHWWQSASPLLGE